MICHVGKRKPFGRRFVEEMNKGKAKALAAINEKFGALKYRLQELCRFNQTHGITAIYVNQRGSEEWDKRAMAGGIGLGHVLDCTVIMDYGEARDPLIKSELDVKHATFVRIFRVLGCRLCGFDGNYHEIEITKDGFVRRI